MQPVRLRESPALSFPHRRVEGETPLLSVFEKETISQTAVGGVCRCGLL